MASTYLTSAETDRALKVNKQYRILCAGPPRGQNLRQWFDKWERLYAKAKAIGHADIESGFIIDSFIESFEQTLPGWAACAHNYLWTSRLFREEPIPDFMNFLKLLRMFCAEDLVAGSTRSSSTPYKKPKDPPPKNCVCGKSHWYTNCFYLIESIRPKGWQSNPKVVEKIHEALKDPKVKANINKARRRRDPRQQALQLTAELSTESQIKANDCDLSNSWFLASGTNIHVCNDPSRFNTTHSTTSNDYLISGSTTYPIRAYGTVDITVTSPTGKRESIPLKQVALIPDFFTNLVSFSRAQAVNVHWDTEKDTLFTVKKGKQDHFCQLTPFNGLWIVAHTGIPFTSLALASPSTSVMIASFAATYTSSEPPGTLPS